MKYFNLFILALLFSVNIFSQNSWKTSNNQKDVTKNWITSFNHNSNYYFYTPVTDTAINITQYSALIKGSNIKTKSNKLDTLATKKSVQNWMVVYPTIDPNFRDSVQTLNRNVFGITVTSPGVSFALLLPNTQYSYYHSILVLANDGDTDYYRGETKIFTTSGLPVAPLLTTEDNVFLITEDGNYITF